MGPSGCLCVSLILCAVMASGYAMPRSKRQNCLGASCDRIRCANPVVDQNGCCMVCPRGDNCILFGHLMPGNQHEIFQDGDCQWTCRCPSYMAYESSPQTTTAVCSMICANEYYSPAQVAQYYDLLQPRNKKRTINKKSLKQARLSWD